MAIYHSQQGDAALASLEQGSDLLESLTAVVQELEISAGSLEVIGAVSKLVLGYYHQDRKEYATLEPEGHFELASGLGNVSMKDGVPFVHLHIVASGSDGAAIGGHAMPGTIVFVAEASIRMLATDAPPVREPDETRGLALW